VLMADFSLPLTPRPVAHPIRESMIRPRNTANRLSTAERACMSSGKSWARRPLLLNEMVCGSSRKEVLPHNVQVRRPKPPRGRTPDAPAVAPVGGDLNSRRSPNQGRS
jgi:hypothetical protein